MPTLWIHRPLNSDILVWFPKKRESEAIQFGLDLLTTSMKYDGCDVLEAHFMEEGLLSLGSTLNLQISLSSSDKFHPNDYTTSHHTGSWNSVGFVQVSEDEAIDLGLTGEPEGFSPGSSQEIWKRDYRTIEELDLELDNYMNQINEEDI